VTECGKGFRKKEHSTRIAERTAEKKQRDGESKALSLDEYVLFPKVFSSVYVHVINTLLL